MSSGVQKVLTGAVTGTGSAIDVKMVGFRPTIVKLYNVGGNANAVWTRDMADASMQKIVDSGAGATDISLVTSDGITPLASGFRIGADSDLNASGEKIIWEAVE
jgi:hypothetical protein